MRGNSEQAARKQRSGFTETINCSKSSPLIDVDSRALKSEELDARPDATEMLAGLAKLSQVFSRQQ